LIKNSKFKQIHNKERYKYFCFSNIFPIASDEYLLLFSSPLTALVKLVKERLFSLKNKSVNFGETEFTLISVHLFNLSIRVNSLIITGTPAVISIAKKDFKKYNTFNSTKIVLKFLKIRTLITSKGGIN